MKYRLPEGCTAVSRAGKALAVAADGTVDLDPAAVADLLPHGIERGAADSKPTTASGGKPAEPGPDKRAPR